jgi:hypothetical protein
LKEDQRIKDVIKKIATTYMVNHDVTEPDKCIIYEQYDDDYYDIITLKKKQYDED